MSETPTVIEPEVQPKPKQKPMPPPAVADMCGDHSLKTWRTYNQHHQPTGQFNCAVMLNVVFHKALHSADCGGVYAGHAVGEIHFDIPITTEMRQKARRLVFLRSWGDFRDVETRTRVSKASILILEDNLHASYIP